MKRFILFILVVLFIGSFLSGCHGIAHSYQERKDRFSTIDYIYARQIVDDCDQVVLLDRPSYMSYWPIRDTD